MKSASRYVHTAGIITTFIWYALIMYPYCMYISYVEYISYIQRFKKEIPEALHTKNHFG